MTKDAITSQSPEEVRQQKYRFSLLCSGNAMILFALWAVVRTIIQFNYQGNIGAENAMFTAWIPMVLAAGIADTVLKLIVGFSARAESLGKRKKGIYIVLGIILAALTVLSMTTWFSVYLLLYENEGILGMIISVAVEITILYAELNLVVSAINVRKIEKEMGRDR